MPTSSPAQGTLTDDDVRWLMVRTAASLGHLWARLERLPIKAGSHPRMAWTSRDIDPPEPWLDVLPRNVALSGVVQAVLLAKALLIDEAVALRSPDRRRVCLIVQHIQCGATEWSSSTLRLARTLGVELAANVMAETHGSSMHTAIYQLDGTYARHSGQVNRTGAKE